MHDTAAVRSTPTHAATQWEFRELSLPRGTSRKAAHRTLTDHAEYGHWELARLRLYPDGTRKATLRRKILRVRRSLSTA
jgi:hypothetical protein